MKDIVKETIKTFGQGRVKYSLITFGTLPNVQVKFSHVFNTDEELKKLVDKVPKAPGKAALDKALEEARYLFGEAEGARPNSWKILFVITDEKSRRAEDNILAAVEKLKKD